MYYILYTRTYVCICSIYVVYKEVFIGMVFCVSYLFCYFLLEYNNTVEENFVRWYVSSRTVMPEEEEEEEEEEGEGERGEGGEGGGEEG